MTAAANAQPSEDQIWDKARKDRASDTADAIKDATATPTPAATATPTPTPSPTPTPATATPTPTPTPAADPYEGMSEATRKLIEGIDTRARTAEETSTKLQRAVDTANGTAGSLKQELEKAKARLAELAPTVDAVSADRKAAEEGKAKEQRKRVEAARAKLSDLLEPEELDLLFPLPVEKQAATATPTPAATATPTPTPSPTPTPTPTSTGDAPDERAVLIEQRKLSDSHPNWMQTRATPEFKEFWKTAPPEIKAIENSWRAADTAKIFDAYKKHQTDAAEVARLAKERDERLRRGEGPRGRGNATPGAPTSEDALWEKAKRDKAAARAANA